MTPIERKAGELLPCPLCGGEAELWSYRSCDCCGKAYNGAVICATNGCGCQVDHFDTDDEAITAWNRRTALTPPAGGLPELPELPATRFWADSMKLDEPGVFSERRCEIFTTLNYRRTVKYDQPLFTTAQLHAYALEAIAASRVGWLPIESAPRKGTFLVFGGEWVGEAKDGNERQPATITLVHRNSRARFYVADTEEYWPWIEGPTHWQPLPAAPQVALNRGGEEGK